MRVKKLGRRDPSHCFIFPQRWLFSSFILLSLSSSLSISLEISLSSERVSDMWPPRALRRGGFLSCTRPTRKMKVKVAQSSPTLPNPMDYTVHGILQARILEWVAFPFSRGSSQSRDQTRSPTLQVDSSPAEPQGKPQNTRVGNLFLLQWIFPTQELNRASCIAGGFFTN